MISRTTHSFWKEYARLSQADQAAARRAFRIFSREPNRHSLRFKKLRGHPSEWSVRITLDLRAVGRRQGDTIEWTWIGSHNDFDNLFG